MTVDEILGVVGEIDRLEADLRAVRAAPPCLEEQLKTAHTEAQKAAESFRLRPWVMPPLADSAAASFVLLGMSMVLAPEATSQLITGQVSRRVSADPREAIDSGTRTKRVAALESKIAVVVAPLSHDDLHTLNTAVAAAHAAYRGLSERLTQAAERADRRAAEITAVQNQRESIWRPPPLPPLAAAGDFSAPVAPLLRRSGEERAAAREAVEQQLQAETRELERDRAAVEGLKAEAAAASERWRVLAQAADRLDKLLARRPVPAAA